MGCAASQGLRHGANGGPLGLVTLSRRNAIKEAEMEENQQQGADTSLTEHEVSTVRQK